MSHFARFKALSIAAGDGNDGDTQAVVGPKTDLVACHANNARVSRPEHLDASSTPQTKFLQTMNILRMSMDAADMRGLTGSQLIERDRAIMHSELRQASV
jgi:hypothetical protein